MILADPKTIGYRVERNYARRGKRMTWIVYAILEGDLQTLVRECSSRHEAAQIRDELQLKLKESEAK